MQEMLNEMMQKLGAYLPQLMGALLILVIGWLVAVVVSLLIRAVLHRTTLDQKMAAWFAGEEKARSLPIENIVARTAFYVIMVFVVAAFFQALQLTVITDPLNRLLGRFFEFIPQLAGAILLLIVAWVVATVLRALIARALAASKLDEKISGQLDAKPGAVPLTKPIAEAVYWLVFLLFLPAVLDVLSLEGLLAPVNEMFNKILGFLPNILGAALILAVGWFIARIVRQIVANLLAAVGCDRLSEKVGLSTALGEKTLSQVLAVVVYFLVLVPVLIAGLNALKLDSITEPASAMLSKILAAVPAVFGAILLLLIAYVVGRVVAGLVANLLAGIGFNGVLAKLGLNATAGESKRTPSEIVGNLALVAIMVFASIEAARMLEFLVLADLITQFLEFAGHVILGLIIFGLGLWLANLAANTVRSSGAAQAGCLATAARVSILVLAAAMALRQMELANDIINLAFALLLGAVAVAVAIAFGLGGREAAAQQLAKWTSQADKKSE